MCALAHGLCALNFLLIIQQVLFITKGLTTDQTVIALLILFLSLVPSIPLQQFVLTYLSIL